MMSRITINLKKESYSTGSSGSFSWESKPAGYETPDRPLSFNKTPTAWMPPRKNIVKADRIFGVAPMRTNLTLEHEDTFELSIMVDKEITVVRS